MRLKQTATERAGRVKPCTGHSWLLECAAPPGAIEFSVLHSIAFHRAIGWRTEHIFCSHTLDLSLRERVKRVSRRRSTLLISEESGLVQSVRVK